MIYTIYGNLPRKSNSRQIIRNKRTGKVQVIKSAKALKYRQQFILQMREYDYETIEEDIKLKAIIYYQSRRSDLSGELLMDLLQDCELIKNDRQVREIHLLGKVDRQKPRVEFEVEILKDTIGNLKEIERKLKGEGK
jgi:Holliday junction resolvase RusA-like endonuclease